MGELAGQVAQPLLKCLGITLLEEGERILLAYTYSQPGRKPNPFRDFVAKRLNY